MNKRNIAEIMTCIENDMAELSALVEELKSVKLVRDRKVLSQMIDRVTNLNARHALQFAIYESDDIDGVGPA